MGLMRFWHEGKVLVAFMSVDRVIEAAPWSVALLGWETSQAAGCSAARRASMKAAVGGGAPLGFIEGSSSLATKSPAFCASLRGVGPGPGYHMITGGIDNRRLGRSSRLSSW